MTVQVLYRATHKRSCIAWLFSQLALVAALSQIRAPIQKGSVATLQVCIPVEFPKYGFGGKVAVAEKRYVRRFRGQPPLY